MEKLLTAEFHKKKVDEVVRLLDANLDIGLTDEKVNAALAKYGKNEEEDEKEKSFYEQIKEQFEDRTVRLLLVAALISFLTNVVCKLD